MSQIWDSLVQLFESLLTSIASHTGNDYGLAIIVVTVLVRIVLWPLAHAQISNMRRVQQIQPELQRIQRRYKHDRARLNEETMRLMRENGANPAAGCLPTLLQLPILYALYIGLRRMPEIAGHSFLWVPDLSKPDPYYVIPLLAGALTFGQSWFTTPRTLSPDNPAAGTQRTMLYLMPVLFFFLCLRYPAGFGLYWVSSSALAVLQYWLAIRLERPLPAASGAVAALGADADAPPPPAPGGAGGGRRHKQESSAEDAAGPRRPAGLDRRVKRRRRRPGNSRGSGGGK